MDTDIIAAIVAVAITSILGWAENRGKKLKRAKAMKKTSVAAARPATAPERPARVAAQAPALSQAATAPARPQPVPYSFTADAEGGGLRHSAPRTEERPVAVDAEAPAGSRDELRKAIIWSEILRRKY